MYFDTDRNANFKNKAKKKKVWVQFMYLSFLDFHYYLDAPEDLKLLENKGHSLYI